MSLDADWYLRCYPDVAQGLSIDRIASAQDHYDMFGRSEGRSPAPNGPTFVIHIGPHKTGTTYLQANLASSRQYLSTKGCLYPKDWIKSGGVSHEKIVQLLEAADCERARAMLAELHGPHKFILISSEDLCLLTLRGVDTLGQALAAYDVRIVFCVRPWPERIASLWKQSLLHSSTETFSEFCLRHMADPASSFAINSSMLLDSWQRVFGDSKIDLISYPDIVANNEDLLHHLLTKMIGITPSVGHRHHVLHASPDIIGAEIARSLNTISKQRNTGGLEGKYFMHNAEMYSTYRLREIMEGYILQTCLRSMSAVWDKLEYDFLTRYGHRFSGQTDILRSFRFSKQEHVSQDYLIHPGVLNMIEELWNQVNRDHRCGLINRARVAS